MSDRFNCPIHGVRLVDSYNDGCPDCQHAAWELRNAVSEAAHATANPGDYVCPHCKFTSLKSRASRCPLCHGEVESEYWSVVEAREKADAERKLAAAQAAAERQKAVTAAAAAEQIRTAPERAAAAARAAAEAQRLRRNASSKENRGTGAAIGAFLGGIVMGLAGCSSCVSHPFHAGDFPVTPFNLFTGLLLGAIGGAVIGAALGHSTGQNKD